MYRAAAGSLFQEDSRPLFFLRTEPIITHHFPLEKINEAFETMKSQEGMKVMVHPHGEGE